MDFFNELSRYCDLTAVYEREKASDRAKEWVSNTRNSYRYKVLEGIRVGSDNAFCPGVISCLRKNVYDIIVLGGYSTPTAMLAAKYMRLRKIPYILNADGGIIRHPERKVNYVVKKYFIGNADWWLSSGEFTNKYLVHYGADSSRVYAYPFTSLHEADIIKKPLTVEEKQYYKNKVGLNKGIIFLAVGQFIPRKGFHALIHEWTKTTHKEAKLVLIGGGEEEEEYRRIAATREDILVLPFKKKSELIEYYYAADMFVLPTNEDIWGLVINEAMAAGLPVISTDRCIAACELECKSVRVMPAGRFDVFCDVMQQWACELDQSDASQCSLDKIRDYTIENMVKVHINCFEKILEGEHLRV